MKGKTSKLKKSLAGITAAVLAVAMIIPTSVMTFAATPGEVIPEESVVATITDGEELYKYASLQDAFDHAEDGDTIVLQKNVKEASGVVWAPSRGAEVTLDLNGHTFQRTDEAAAIIVGPANQSTNVGNYTATLNVVGSGKVIAADYEDAFEAIFSRVRQSTWSSWRNRNAQININGKIDVYGYLFEGGNGGRGNITVYQGTFNRSVEDYVAPVSGDNVYAEIRDNGTFFVDKLTPVWSEWTPAPAGLLGAKPSCTIDLVSSAYGLSYFTYGPEQATVTELPAVPPTCTEEGYTGYFASYDALDDLGYEFGNPDLYKTNIVPATGHTYEASSVKFSKTAGVVDEDAYGNLIYTATITCDNCDLRLAIEGSVSKTVGETTTYTDAEGTVIQTKTVSGAPIIPPTCEDTGWGLDYTVDILDAEGSKYVTANLYDTTAIVPTVSHDFTLGDLESAYSPYMVWVINGVEKQAITAADVQGLTVVPYRVYAKCTYGCGTKELLTEGEVAVTTTAPSLKIDNDGFAYGEDGSIVVPDAEYIYDVSALESVKKILDGVTANLPAYADEQEEILQSSIAIDYETRKITPATNEDYGLIEGTPKGAINVVKQRIEKIPYTWEFVRTVAATADDAGYDYYQAKENAERFLVSYNGLTAPISGGTGTAADPFVVGSATGSDCKYPALGYTYKVAKLPNGQDDDVTLIPGVTLDEDVLEVGWVLVNNATGEEVPGVEYVEYSVAAEDLVISDPTKISCTENISYMTKDAVRGSYVYTRTTKTNEEKLLGIHGPITGTVNWAEDGTASVGLKCNDCGLAIPEANNLKVEEGEIIPKSCLVDGHTPFTAVYTGQKANVTLKNDTFKGNIVPATGHALDTQKVQVTNNGGVYSAKIYCDVCEELVDVVTKVEGPTVQTDRTKKIDIYYTNGLPNAPVLGPISRTIIDNAKVNLEEESYEYGTITDVTCFGVVDSVIIENGLDVSGNCMVVVKDADGEEVKWPEDIDDEAPLPVGYYTVDVYAVGDTYIGTATGASFVVVEAKADFHLEYTSTEDEQYAFSAPYDGKEHGFSYEAHSNATDKWDPDVEITYAVNGGMATPNMPLFVEAGVYKVVTIATKDGFEPVIIKDTFTITKPVLTVAIDNATMKHGVLPEIKSQVTNPDGTAFADVDSLGLTITTAGVIADFTALDSGVYALTACISNTNYKIVVTGGVYQTSAPTLTVEKGEQEITATVTNPTVKYSKVKKRNVKIKNPITVTNNEGKLTYAKASGKKNFTVAKNGKITVKKGTKKGTYKIKVKVTAAATNNVDSASKTVKVVIK
jgi:hypothetical protein